MTCGRWEYPTYLLGQCKALWVSDGSQLLLLQLLDGVLLVPQIQLGAHQDDGGGGAVVPHLGVPLEGAHTHTQVGLTILVRTDNSQPFKIVLSLTPNLIP